MEYLIKMKKEIEYCWECLCNFSDGKQFYCRLLKRFDVNKEKDCPLIKVYCEDRLGGTLK